MTGPVRRLRLAARALVRGEPKNFGPSPSFAPANGSAAPSPPRDGIPAVSLVCSSLVGEVGQVRYIAFHSPGSASDPVFVAASEPIGAVLSNLAGRWPRQSLEISVPRKEVAA